MYSASTIFKPSFESAGGMPAFGERVMGLNIKHPQAHALALALARETGETMTRAVIEALRERLERVRRTRQVVSADELLAIGRRCAAGMSRRSMTDGDLLYDERGLPG